MKLIRLDSVNRRAYNAFVTTKDSVSLLIESDVIPNIQGRLVIRTSNVSFSVSNQIKESL